VIGRGRIQPQCAPQPAFGGWPQQWSPPPAPAWLPSGLGAEALAQFVRKGGAKERMTMADWQAGLQSGKINPDGTTEGVRWVRVLAYGTNEAGREIVLAEQVPWPSLAKNIFRYGDVIPHPTRGVLYVQPFVYDPSKSLEDLISESNDPKTLRCTVQCGQNGVTWCKTADYTDAQAQGWVSVNRKKLDCTAIGTKTPGKYVVNADGSIVWQGAQPGKSGGDKVYCPSAVLQQPAGGAPPGTLYAMSAQDDETLTTVRAGNEWAKKHPCESMACRDVDTGRAVKFYNCPKQPGGTPSGPGMPGGGGAPGGGTFAGMSMGTLGLAAAAIAVVAALAFKKKGEPAIGFGSLPPPAASPAAEARR